jgi:hypothetical protein
MAKSMFSKYFKVWVQFGELTNSRVIIGKCNTYIEACHLLDKWLKENPNVKFHAKGMISYK